ncbi:unnamed protein product [Amoebophrya sp. A120]|nr:unnamed protein product [Amoebophrya sp. A120]|eukprot:GSA120T00020060001.1
MTSAPAAAPAPAQHNQAQLDPKMLKRDDSSYQLDHKCVDGGPSAMRHIPTQTTLAPSCSAGTLYRGSTMGSSNSLWSEHVGPASGLQRREESSSSLVIENGVTFFRGRETLNSTPSLLSPRNDSSIDEPDNLPQLSTSKTLSKSSTTAATSSADEKSSPSLRLQLGEASSATTDGVLAGLPLERDPAPENSVTKAALNIGFPILLLYRLAFLYIAKDAEAIESTSIFLSAQGFGDVSSVFTIELVANLLTVEVFAVTALAAFFLHWKDCGHFLSVWVFLVYTHICGIRFFMYEHPLTRFLPLLLGTCCIPYLTQWVQIHSLNTHATEVRVPPFPMKKHDYVNDSKQTFQTPAYLGNFLASRITNDNARWAVTLFLYAFPTIGAFIGIYRGYIFATTAVVRPTTPSDQDTVVILVSITIAMSAFAAICDMIAYGIAIFSLFRLGQNVKNSKEVYTTGPYEPPRLDNDTIDKLIAKAKYVKMYGNKTPGGSQFLIGKNAMRKTIDSIVTPVAANMDVESCADGDSYHAMIDVDEDVFREMTVVLPAYMPNEEDIILDVLEYYKREEPKYPGGYKVLLVWNSPKQGDAHKEITEKLAEFEKQWPKFKALRIMESTCKADNLNVAIRMLDTDFALFNDSDTIVSAETMCRAAMHIFGPEQYDVAQGRNIYCKDDYEGFPEGPDSFRPTTALMAFRDSFAQTNTFMGLLFERSNFNGRGGFWRTSAVKQVEFDTRTLAEDHDASCRGFMYFGQRGVLDNNMLCQEREPATLATINKQRRRWMHCALQIMDRTISWNWSSKSTKGFLERWIYWYTYTENRTPTESPLFYLFYFEVFGMCCRAHQEFLNSSEHTEAAWALEAGYQYMFWMGLFALILRVIYIGQHVSQCRYNPAWFRLCIPVHMVSMVLQGCYHKLHAYHDYYWGTGKWVCTARATAQPKSTAGSAAAASTMKEPLLG